MQAIAQARRDVVETLADAGVFMLLIALIGHARLQRVAKVLVISEEVLGGNLVVVIGPVAFVGVEVFFTGVRVVLG